MKGPLLWIFRTRRRAVAAALALAVVAVAGWVALARETPVRSAAQRIEVPAGPRGGGPVSLDTTFYAPDASGRRPAVLLAHGFGGSKESVRAQAVRLARAGYAVLTWSARGFGRSTGQIALNSPDHEVRDVRRLIDWLAGRPEVRLDGPGDPRVGMAGASYGGAISLLTAAHDRRVDALVPSITWNDLADALFPNAAGPADAGVFKKMWAGVFFGAGGVTPDTALLTGGRAGEGSGGATESDRMRSGSEGSGPVAGTTPSASPAPPGPSRGPGGARPGGAATDERVRCGRFLPEICAIYQKVAETGRPTPEAVAMLRRSSPSAYPGRIKVPTLLLQGLNDSLFPLDHADRNAALVDGPAKVVWFDGGHDGGDGEADRLHELTVGWFDRWLLPARSPHGLAGGPGAGTPGFEVTRQGGRDPGTRRRVLTVAEAARYPGLSGTAARKVRLAGPEQAIANPPGGAPASITSLPGLGSALSGGGDLGLSLDMPGQAAVFESAPLPESVDVTGSPSVRVRVSGPPGAVLFAKVYDVGPMGPRLPYGLAAPMRITGAGGEAEVRLPAIDHRFEAGHRVRLVVAASDMGYATPAASSVHRVALAAPDITLPLAPALRGPGTGPPWWVWALPPAALLLAALILAGVRRRTRPPAAPDPALAGVPLEISGLTKRYSGGRLAVDDLSFRVERGQVLGLLGPNGAGKTTSLRMLMGLIHPDAGQIRIFGHAVAPGVPVLSRLGSFVEGPGFLPHLSGRDNLELYWRATGRPAEDAHLAEALEIAGLGDALGRAVRTYSQGMRQRLAIAQAMLGLPDLLVLDEPTNGLDPPQIRGMRDVLLRYAAGGRTVIVSSHLLAEVEQTCSHVVVMHRGRLVTAGPVAEIVGSGAGVLVGTPDPERAREVAKGVDGVDGAELADGGVLVRLGSAPASLLVAELVGAGVPVDRVTPNRRLEDAFLTLIGERDE
ncbi:alpha/beta fold hydrolase [Bailinhaonella thermotolerans]|uniref:Alpha/beta fold hydrolase n=1 Tax=Bailinhaonella thermotolerans TaxID=1070861 RepID=A0A3A4B9C2_9ACTN|nr:alpha/beta fold hydrolase [Bailinhaonella thermotolerans]RJL34304.1 alpha/beta fold hydrolase [Bailinhaonella thermotolerans]